LATDLGIAVPLEHGLHSALIAMRLCELLSVDPDTARQAYYTSLLYYIGCTASATTAADIFGEDDALTTYAMPARFGAPVQTLAGMARAVAPPDRPQVVRAMRLARGLPRLAREFPGVEAANCDVAEMLMGWLGLPASVSALFVHANDRWDGKRRRRRGKSPSVANPGRTSSSKGRRSTVSPIPRERLDQIAVPTTLIWGRRDVGVPVRVAEVASARFVWPLH